MNKAIIMIFLFKPKLDNDTKIIIFYILSVTRIIPNYLLSL